MTKVEAIIQVSKLESVKNSLHEIGVEGMTVLEPAATEDRRGTPSSIGNGNTPSISFQR